VHHESTNEPGGAKCPGKGFYPDESRTLFLVCWLPLLKSSRTGRAGLFFRAQRSACSRDSATPSTHETDEAVSPMAPSPAATALVDHTLTRPHGLPDRSTYGRRPHRRAAHRGQSDGQWGQPLQAFHAACRSAPVSTQRQALLAQHWRPRGVTLPRGQALLVDERDSGGPGLGAFHLRRAPRHRVRPRGDDQRTTPAMQRRVVAVTQAWMIAAASRGRHARSTSSCRPAWQCRTIGHGGIMTAPPRARQPSVARHRQRMACGRRPPPHKGKRW